MFVPIYLYIYLCVQSISHELIYARDVKLGSHNEVGHGYSEITYSAAMATQQSIYLPPIPLAVLELPNLLQRETHHAEHDTIFDCQVFEV